jgi:hypothetical protein
MTTTTLTLNFVTGSESTGITATANYPSGATAFTIPLAAGTVVATAVVTPSSWSGTLTTDNPDFTATAAGPSGSTTFAIETTATYNTAGSLTLTLTATP